MTVFVRKEDCHLSKVLITIQSQVCTIVVLYHVRNVSVQCFVELNVWRLKDSLMYHGQPLGLWHFKGYCKSRDVCCYYKGLGFDKPRPFVANNVADTFQMVRFFAQPCIPKVLTTPLIIAKFSKFKVFWKLENKTNEILVAVNVFEFVKNNAICY